MAYEPTFTKAYPGGWKDLPEETTPIIAAALNKYDSAITAIENQLKSTTGKYDENISAGRKAGETVGTRSAGFGTQVVASGENSVAFGYFSKAT